MISLEFKLFVLFGCIAVILIAFGAGYHYGTKHQKAADAQTKLDAIADNENLKRKLEAKTNEANTALDFILSLPGPRVRLPSCPPHPTIPTSVSSVPATSPQRASNPAQDALENAGRGMESDAAEWSRALNKCQELQDWANQIGRPAK